MAKKKAKIDREGYVTFLNDEDGFSAKDYLLVISTVVFFGFIVVGLVLVLFGIPIHDDYIKLLDMVDLPLMTIIGSVVGYGITEKIVDSKKDKNSYHENKYDNEEI